MIVGMSAAFKESVEEVVDHSHKSSYRMVKQKGSSTNSKDVDNRTQNNTIRSDSDRQPIDSNTDSKTNKNPKTYDNQKNYDKTKINDQNSNDKPKRADPKPHQRPEERERKRLRRIVRRESKRILQVVVPIFICMSIVVVAIQLVPLFTTGIEHMAREFGIGFYEKKDSGAGSKIGSALILIVIFIAILAFVTFCMAMIIVYKWKRLMNGFFVFAFVIYLGLLMTIILSMFLNEYNVPMDWITVFLFLVNYTVLGEMVFFVGGPKILQQTYLIIIASNVALLFILILPTWTTWLLLVVLCVWDLYIVLHETGPLNRIFNSGANDLPPILYATAIWRLQTNRSAADEGNYEIGLGDFVFYSILVGKSFSSGDFFTAIICFVSILVGLAVTMFILMMTDRPLPALPISIVLGVLANFSTHIFIVPFNDMLTERLIFI